MTRSWLHRLALATCVVAVCTMTAGTLVTSKNAGMAFRDWPTSDGQNMLTYPWLADFARNWDKFLEHGHRLAGIVIGLFSIAIAVTVNLFETRRWVRFVSVGVLLAVIVQGLIGGFRVELDERGLALVHGAFAACVLSLMAVLATALSRSWEQAPRFGREADVSWLTPLAAITVAMLAGQFVIGGMIRHFGTALHEHLVFGVVAILVVLAYAVATQFSGVAWIRRSGQMFAALILLQATLGAGAWVTRFGFPSSGYVATADSIEQVALGTAHAVTGILLLTTSVVSLTRVLRVSAASQAGSNRELSSASLAAGGTA